MFEFFRKSSQKPKAESTGGTGSGITIEYAEEGIRYQTASGNALLKESFSSERDKELQSRLSQLALEGVSRELGATVLLPWSDVYKLSSSVEFTGYLEPLGIPADRGWKPSLATQGALGDQSFSVSIADWVDSTGRPIRPAPQLEGAVLNSNGLRSLLSHPAFSLVEDVKRFHTTPIAQRDQKFKEFSLGHMRRSAIAADCPMSDYVSRTVILTPDSLKLDLRKAEGSAGSVVEVIPGFQDAPAAWLDVFDRLPLQDSYEIPQGPSLVRVLVSEEIKSVLQEIKRMPARRIAGERGEAFIRNPFALLGETATKVLDTSEVERARRDAGIVFERFTPVVRKSSLGAVESVGIQIDALSESDGDSETIWFADPDELQLFIDRLDQRLRNGAMCCLWKGHELEILGDTPADLEMLQLSVRQWRCPQLWSAEEVLDLSRYSDRVEAIGVEAPFVVPVVVQDNPNGDWFESNVSIGLQVNDPNKGQIMLPLTFGEVLPLQRAVEQAEADGAQVVHLPGLSSPVPLQAAKDAVALLMHAQQDLIKPESLKVGGGQGAEKPRLIIKRNFDQIDYTESRAEALFMPEGHKAVIPNALKPSVQLREHQHIGIAWLQHLWRAAPERCRGTVLADDMGLGKTLQLLTFMVSCFEENPSLHPALVVAPVALLENWKNELAAFFEPESLPLLTLYGSELQQRRTGRDEVDETLQRRGLNRLLKKGWLGDAKLVLTTYETMRDLEFSLAAQPWSIMVCDEAQKIKSPSALVTTSAKKQQARFRIACTGTPVENTLADLWCLFDFVQPGMLGALNQFSRIYRRPIEAKTEEQRERVEELRELIKPQILHRKKTDVAKDLPAPIEDTECKYLPMSDYQQALYEGAVQELVRRDDVGPNAQLQALQAIRQICSDPHGYAESSVRDIPIQRLVNESPKMGWLVNKLKELAAKPEQSHKVIVFCEFRELQLTLQRVIAAFFGFTPYIINGDTSADPASAMNRQKLIDEFQQSVGFGAIILSPLAVGFGVNIQAANHVIHFTRTWNPAKEDQATARAYRIGQKRVVTVYYPGVVSQKFVTFDQKLDMLLQRKRSLASDMLNGCSDLKVADFAEMGLLEQ